MVRWESIHAFAWGPFRANSRGGKLPRVNPGYLFSVISQSCSTSYVHDRFSDGTSETPGACLLDSSLFHPGGPRRFPTEDDDDEDDDEDEHEHDMGLNRYKPWAKLFGHFGPQTGPANRMTDPKHIPGLPWVISPHAN